MRNFSQREGYKCDISAGHKGKRGQHIINRLLVLNRALNTFASIDKNREGLPN